MNKRIYIEALDLEKAGDWDGAHRLIQQYETPEACMIHAYLHRKEGDISNADYWYHRAGRKSPDLSLDEEWQEIRQQMEML